MPRLLRRSTLRNSGFRLKAGKTRPWFRERRGRGFGKDEAVVSGETRAWFPERRGRDRGIDERVVVVGRLLACSMILAPPRLSNGCSLRAK